MKSQVALFSRDTSIDRIISTGTFNANDYIVFRSVFLVFYVTAKPTANGLPNKSLQFFRRVGRRGKGINICEGQVILCASLINVHNSYYPRFV